MTERDAVSGLVATLAPRAGPLIITVFGDAIAPRSRDIWLGSLIDMMAELGLSERLVRTGVYRLAREGWLESRSRGRRSYYALTSSGTTIFAEADARIYAARPPDWDGRWTLVQALPQMNAAQRQALRKALTWQGFGQLSSGLMAKPQRRDPKTALKGLEDIAPAGGVSVFSASLEELAGTACLPDVAAAAWDLAGLNTAYQDFAAAFAPFADQMPATPARAFALRIVLIHEYRRILLKDPQLPQALLPQDWSGTKARDLAACLYRAVAVSAEAFIAETLENWQGRNTDLPDSLKKRFA